MGVNSTHISLDLLSLGCAKAYIGRGGKLNIHFMASCVKNIRTKNYQHLIIEFQVIVENVGDGFLGQSVYLQGGPKNGTLFMAP